MCHAQSLVTKGLRFESGRRLVNTIRGDLTVDWADRESTEAAIRAKVKRVLRRLNYQPPAGGGGPFSRNGVVDLVLEQAHALSAIVPKSARSSSRSRSLSQLYAAADLKLGEATHREDLGNVRGTPESGEHSSWIEPRLRGAQDARELRDRSRERSSLAINVRNSLGRLEAA